MNQRESNTFQAGLIEDFCQRKGLDKKPGAIKWCTDGHAEQCRSLLDLGIPTIYITNPTLELMIDTKKVVTDSRKNYEDFIEETRIGARELVGLSFLPLDLQMQTIQRIFGNRR